VKLVGVADPRPLSVGTDPGIPVVSSVAELIEHELDLAVVAVPTALHSSVALELAAAGVHTLIEKPVAEDVTTSLQVADEFERAGLIGCVGHIERYNPALQDLRVRLQRGEVGDIYQVATRRQGPFPEWIGDFGVVLDLATHDVDLTSWVTQQPYAAVAARTAHRSNRQREDLVAVVGTLADGTVVNHLVNWLSPLKERVTVVTGEGGTFVADTVAGDLTHYSNGMQDVEWESLRTFRGVVQGDVVRYAIAKREPLLVELEAFRDAVLGVNDHTVSIRDAARTVAVAEAMIGSALSGRTQVPSDLSAR
jgi:UDP-N-acetylglucosamine 3-dehydrogenase